MKSRNPDSRPVILLIGAGIRIEVELVTLGTGRTVHRVIVKARGLPARFIRRTHLSGATEVVIAEAVKSGLFVSEDLTEICMAARPGRKASSQQQQTKAGEE
jgi:hypothetical protein